MSAVGLSPTTNSPGSLRSISVLFRNVHSGRRTIVRSAIGSCRACRLSGMSDGQGDGRVVLDELLRHRRNFFVGSIVASSRILAIVAIAAAPKNNVVEAAKMAQRGANSCSAASASDAPRLVTSHPAIIPIQSHTSRDGFQN